MTKINKKKHPKIKIILFFAKVNHSLIDTKKQINKNKLKNVDPSYIK